MLVELDAFNAWLMDLFTLFIGFYSMPQVSLYFDRQLKILRFVFLMWIGEEQSFFVEILVDKRFVVFIVLSAALLAKATLFLGEHGSESKLEKLTVPLHLQFKLKLYKSLLLPHFLIKTLRTMEFDHKLTCDKKNLQRVNLGQEECII